MTSLESFIGTRTIGAYYESWSANWAVNGETHDLVKINPSINIIYLSFAHPNCSYTKGSNSFTGTGLQFSSNFDVIKNAIQILKNKVYKLMQAFWKTQTSIF